MTEAVTTHSRGLVRSMLVIGGAQMINILISLVRMKVLAVLLGPIGIGLLSIYNNLQSMVMSAAGLGMGSSGVRQIASVRGEANELSRVRRVLLAAHMIQGGLAMVLVWFLRKPLAESLLGDDTYATEVGLIGIAVLLGLLAVAQTALLQGLRKIGDLGRVTVLGAFAGTLVGLLAVWFLGMTGLIWFVLAQPLATLLTAYYFTRRLPRSTGPKPDVAATWAVWKPMARLGVAFMLGSLATVMTLLLVRALITQELGLGAAGQFAAAWGITMTYVGFLLSAMGADYYPRLTEVINDRSAATQLMNDQAQLGLAIGGPVLLVLIGLAPWVITLLYSAEFAPAATLLQWQTVGNVFKLASWALSFSIVAAARAKTYFFLELSFNIVFISMVWMLLPGLGLIITAIAFLAAYIVYFAVANILARYIHGFHWQSLSLQLLMLHGGLAFMLLGLGLIAEPFLAAILALALALVTGVLGLRVVLIKIGPNGRFVSHFFRVYAAIGWPVRNSR